MIGTVLFCSWFFYFAWVCLIWLAENVEWIGITFDYLDQISALPTIPYLPVKIVLIPAIAILGIIWGALPAIILISAHRFVVRRRSYKNVG
ncbi:MAG TPA: hypothetical protein DD728_04560 [Hyphomonas atlantica]|uniref:Uncharacterized protein n=1 Tax=Hyphomonas atlantica TaxID=1280948 RepID=A0A356W3H2_9PROT|nr:hypothetical protein [Rhodospirillaceae bacterium]HBQ48150.1 hypothetical protein [Hyphomonas atlantica]